MVAPLYVRALGARVAISFDESVSDLDAARFGAAWKDAIAEIGPEDASVRVFLGTTWVKDAERFDVAAVTFDNAIASLSTKVTLAAIERRKSELLMLHACGVATSDGLVYAFVGPSGRGKTTLVSALGRDFAYVSDETIGIEIDGSVVEYRKPLSRVTETGTKTQTSASELGLRPLPDADLRIAGIVVMERRTDWDGPPEVRPMPLVASLLALVPEMSYLASIDRPLRRFAELITSLGGVKALWYREAEDVRTLVPGAFAGRDDIDAWHPLGPEPVDRTVLSAGMIRRIEPLDGLVVGDAMVLLHGTSIAVLDGIGPAIWEAARHPISLAELVREIVRRFGYPEGAEPTELVRQAVDALIGIGVLEGSDQQ